MFYLEKKKNYINKATWLNGDSHQFLRKNHKKIKP